MFVHPASLGRHIVLCGVYPLSITHLVRVRKTTHTRHNAEYVVVGRVDVDVDGLGSCSGTIITIDCRRSEGQLQSRVVDTGHIASATGLVLLRLECEGVDVDAGGRDVGVVLVRLDEVEVAAFALAETVVAVELELGGGGAVLAGVEEGNAGDTWVITRPRVLSDTTRGIEGLRLTTTGVQPAVCISVTAVRAAPRSTLFHTILAEQRKSPRIPHRRRIRATHTTAKRVGRSAGVVGLVDSIREVEPLLATNTLRGHTLARSVLVRLSHPHKLLARVVEVQLNLVARGVDTFLTGELKLLNEVLVGDLGEAAALVGVEVDVVDVEGGRGEVEAAREILAIAAGRPVDILCLAEFQVNLDLVVLESNERKGKTGVAAEPELERNVEGGLWDHRTSAIVHLGQSRDVTDHIGVTGLQTRLLSELVPDVEPLAVLLVHTLATNLNLDVVNEDVANPVEPAEAGVLSELPLGKSDLEVHTVHQVTVTGDGAGHLLAEVGGAVEHLLDGFHREVGVAPVDDLEEGNLRVASEVDVLSPVGYKLHKSAAHCRR